MSEKETAVWKLPYPTSVGEVKLGAKDIEELAAKLETLFTERNLGSIQLASGAKAGGQVSRTLGVEYEPSASRPVYVMVEIGSETEAWRAFLELSGGAAIQGQWWAPAVGTIHTAGFWVLPAVKWKITATKGTPTVRTTYLTF